MTTKNTKAKKTARKLVTTGKELPIMVRLPSGEEIIYTKKGEKVDEATWPSPHTTIPNAIKNGLIEEIE